MSDITIHSASWLYNPGQPPLSGGAVAVREGRILAIGTAAELTQQFGAAAMFSHPDCVLLPGFVNAHTHLELTRFPAWRLKDGLDYHPRGFVDWIVQMVKVRRGVGAEDIPLSLADGIAACLRAGTTCVGDIVTQPELLAVYQQSAIAGQLFLELIGQDNAIFAPRLHKALAALDSYQGSQTTALSPHAPYTLSAAVLPALAEAAHGRTCRLSLHLAESPDEDRFLFDSGGPLAELLYPLVGWSDYLPPVRRTTPTRWFDQAGLLGARTLAVHCVQLTPADTAILKQRGCTICLCPRSNERLAVGTAPVHLFKKQEIPLCIGTDSLASNDSLSLWDELRFALDCYKGELGPEELLRMATADGALALGLEAEVGTLEPGRRADLQVLELEGECTAERLLERGRLQQVLLAGQVVA